MILLNEICYSMLSGTKSKNGKEQHEETDSHFQSTNHNKTTDIEHLINNHILGDRYVSADYIYII